MTLGSNGEKQETMSINKSNIWRKKREYIILNRSRHMENEFKNRK